MTRLLRMIINRLLDSVHHPGFFSLLTRQFMKNDDNYDMKTSRPAYFYTSDYEGDLRSSEL